MVTSYPSLDYRTPQSYYFQRLTFPPTGIAGHLQNQKEQKPASFLDKPISLLSSSAAFRFLILNKIELAIPVERKVNVEKLYDSGSPQSTLGLTILVKISE